MYPLEHLEELKKAIQLLKNDPDCADMREGGIEAALDKAFDLGRREQARKDWNAIDRSDFEEGKDQVLLNLAAVAPSEGKETV